MQIIRAFPPLSHADWLPTFLQESYKFGPRKRPPGHTFQTIFLIGQRLPSVEAFEIMVLRDPMLSLHAMAP